MGAEFSKSAMGAPGDWKLERLKHHHILVLLLYSSLNAEKCLIAISRHPPEFIARRPTLKRCPGMVERRYSRRERNPFRKGNKGVRKGGWLGPFVTS